MNLSRTALAAVILAGASAFAQTTDVWQQRLLEYKPYDGAGRYKMSADDGVRGIEGLKELASRWGQKPYDLLKDGEAGWMSERVIFRDVDTGAVMARLTNDPWTDQISYFHTNWSADGQYIIWRRRPAMWEPSTPTHGPMAMRADGTGLRNVFRDYPMVRNEVCSPVDPNVCFATPSDRKVVAFDIATGKKIRELHDIAGCWHVKISLDGKYLMGRSDLTKGGKGFWILSADGTEFYEVPTDAGVHDSYQFHPSLANRIMFWYDGRYRTEGFVQCDFQGGNVVKVPVLFDWNHGDVGPDRGVHTDGYITRIEGETWLEREPTFAKPGVEYYDDPHDFNGYLAWRPKDQRWVYSTRILRPPHVSEIHSFYAEPAADGVVNRFRICYTGLKRGGALDNPNASPDGTKVLFNSNMFGRVDVFSVVAKLPEPPVDLKAEPIPDGVRLTWQPPKHHAEIAGYHVYRSAESGRNFVPITEKPVADLRFAYGEEFGLRGIYAVTAVEHSGLESPLSAEVTLNPLARHSVTIEVEDGARTVEMWKALHGAASNLHYVWLRRKDAPGKVTLNAKLPVSPFPWMLWARVKGETAVQFTAAVAGLTARADWGPAADWTWVRFAGYLPLKSGANEITLRGSAYGNAVDCLVATDDPAFQPGLLPKVRWPALAAPAQVKAEAVSPWAVRLSWNPVAGRTVHHYNVYASAQPNVSARQELLVASPDVPSAIDWGLKSGQALHYVVTAVDRAMNESAPSPVARAAPPAVDFVKVEKDAAATVTFEVPRKDTYVVWLKLKHGEGGNYIDVGVDGQKRTWTCGFDGLADTAWFSYGSWGLWTLEPGQHTLTIDNKTKNEISKVLITNDQWQQPEGHVNTLGGW